MTNSIFENYSFPDIKGHFKEYGGRFVPETLIPALQELETTFNQYKNDPEFINEFKYYLNNFVGRPTPLYYAEKLTKHLGGPKIYLKREDLCHTGAHKINNALGQALLAKRMGKTRIIAETGAGQHGVATATVAARFGFDCVVYMGEVDIKRQSPNVFRMKMLGTEVRSVTAGQKTLKEAVSEAIRDWIATSKNSHYILGSALGPHPFPMMVREFQKIIGIEAREQIIKSEGKLPDALVACVGGGSNSIGLFYPFLKDDNVRMIGVEAGGKSIKLGDHAARFSGGKLGVLQGTKTYILQDENGQISNTHSVSAGLDYAAVGPEHALLHDLHRAEYSSANDEEALEAFKLLNRIEGILPALESSHAAAWIIKNYKEFTKDQIVVVNLSGRGDKDVPQIQDRMNLTL